MLFGSRSKEIIERDINQKKVELADLYRKYQEVWKSIASFGNPDQLRKHLTQFLSERKAIAASLHSPAQYGDTKDYYGSFDKGIKDLNERWKEEKRYDDALIQKLHELSDLAERIEAAEKSLKVLESEFGESMQEAARKAHLSHSHDFSRW